jgi:hypothetical protein
MCGADRTGNSTVYTDTNGIAPSGRGTFRARDGTMPPANLASPPPLEGFTPCVMFATFNDGTFGGADFEYIVGAAC